MIFFDFEVVRILRHGGFGKEMKQYLPNYPASPSGLPLLCVELIMDLCDFISSNVTLPVYETFGIETSQVEALADGVLFIFGVLYR